MEERYHATTQNRFYPDMFIVNKNITVEANRISPPTYFFNSLKPNDPYRGRAAPLNSKRCILYIYSTNVGTEYFKNGIYSPFFPPSSKCSLFHSSNVFGACIIQILYTGCAKIKRNNSAPKRLNIQRTKTLQRTEI